MINEIKELIHIDWFTVVLGVVSALLVFRGLCELFGWFMKKFGIETKSMREKRENKELLMNTAKNLDELQKKHTADEESFRKNLNDYMRESREDRKVIHEEMKQYSQNRIDDRKQSFQIQKELTDSIKEIVKSQSDRDNQIVALMEGSKELLGDTIDQRYNKYISLKGIPQNEVDEFDAIYNAYRGLKGNHGRQTKYEYVKKHLPVLPVKTEIVTGE